MEQNYKVAMAEVLEFLKYVDEDIGNKVSKSFIEFLKENADKDYKCDLDFTKPLYEVNFSKEATAIITFMYCRFWATKEEKEKVWSLLDRNEKEHQKELSEKYSYEKMFNSNGNVKSDDSKEENSLITEDEFPQNQNIFRKILEFFKNLFKKV